MFHELYIENIEDIQIYGPTSRRFNAARIVLKDCLAPLMIVIPSGDILDEVAHRLLQASLDATELDEGRLVLKNKVQPKGAPGSA